MSPVKVPQNLDLEDVLVWGLGAVDLFVLGTAGLIAWWLWTGVSTVSVRVAAVAPIVLLGTLLGPGSFQGRALRDWLLTLARYHGRPRRRVFGDEP